MIIDGHAHACGNYLTNDAIDKTLSESKVDYVILTAGELRSAKVYAMSDKTARYPTRDIANDKKILIGFVVKLFGVARQIPKGNEYVHSLKKENAKVKQFYWVTNERISELRDRYDEMGFDGMKVHQCWVNKRIDSPWFADLIRFAVKLDMPLFIHLSSRKEIDQIIEISGSHRDAKIIIGHCVGLERFIENKDSVSDNTYFDISNNYFVSADRIKNAIETFGASRVVLGSDSPYGKDSLRLTIERIRAMDISEGDQEDILGNNLARILKIPPQETIARGHSYAE